MLLLPLLAIYAGMMLTHARCWCSFLFLTNSSERSPQELQQKLHRMGIEVKADNFYTSALATAKFLQSQKPNGTCYVIGEPGLMVALYDVGYTMNEVDPDYVVIGESKSYTFERLSVAINLVRKGAKLIGACQCRCNRMHGDTSSVDSRR